MLSPDRIADEALLTISRWRREAMVNRALAAWWQGKDDGLPPEQRFNDNQSMTDWQRENEVVQHEMEAAHV